MNDDHKPGMNRAIGEVLDGLLHAARAEDEGLLRQVENDETIQRAIQSAKQYDWDAFRFTLVYPLERLVRAIASQVTQNPDAEFLLMHGDFVERHFRKLFETFEGRSCCADKARTVMAGLLRYYLDGTRVSFNYEQPHTFNLPAKIFRTHEDIVAFAGALQGLYYGQPAAYLQALRRIQQVAAREDAGANAERNGRRRTI